MKNFLLPTLALLLGTAACGSAPTEEEYDDVATSMSGILADGAASETEAVDDAATAAQGQLPAAMTRAGQGNLQGRRGTVDYNFTLTCSDAAGAVLQACEGADSAHLVLDWSGQVETARRSATLERHGDWTLTGLTTAEATLNGTGSLHVEGTFQALARAEMRSYVFDYQAEYQDVLVNRAERRIVGGNATYTISADRTAQGALRNKERHFDVVAEVTFLGDGQAQVVLDGERSYTVDLKNGAVSKNAAE